MIAYSCGYCISALDQVILIFFYRIDIFVPVRRINLQVRKAYLFAAIDKLRIRNGFRLFEYRICNHRICSICRRLRILILSGQGKADRRICNSSTFIITGIQQLLHGNLALY